MAIGKVNIVKMDGNQGSFAEAERVFLYLGEIGDESLAGELIPVGAADNLDTLLGSADSELKTQIASARENAESDNWVCYAYGLGTDETWTGALDKLLEKPHDVNIEACVVCTPFAAKAEVTAAGSAAASALSKYAKFISVIGCVSGIETTESWSEYLARVNAVIDGVADERIMVVPQLHGNNLGIICGRLCNPAVSIADSPMRVATGALVGLGAAPVDKNGAALSMATIQTLSEARFCVPQWYAGYDGVYWADMMTLAAEGSDFSVYENPRVLDYCARRVRILAIARIADRRLNNTTQSIEANKTYFMRPLLEASHPIMFGNQELPAMIQAPQDGDITITWTSRTEVSIAITARPYNCPKKITVYLGLDLSGN